MLRCALCRLRPCTHWRCGVDRFWRRQWFTQLRPQRRPVLRAARLGSLLTRRTAALGSQRRAQGIAPFQALSAVGSVCGLRRLNDGELRLAHPGGWTQTQRTCGAFGAQNGHEKKQTLQHGQVMLGQWNDQTLSDARFWPGATSL